MVRENPYITIKIRINEEQKYHTVRTVPKSNRKTKNTTLSEQFQNLTEKQKIPHCQNSSKI
jgi:cytochrome c-type biogenesis protein CcmH/NrfF